MRTRIVGHRGAGDAGDAWPLLAERLGAEVVVKHENHTPTGAFKVRGGLVYLERLKRERPDVPGIISATRGNHGQSLALCRGPPWRARGDLCAARQLGREEPRHARVRRRARSSTARTSRPRGKRPSAAPSSPACTWCRRSIRTWCSASRPTRSNCSASAPDLDILYVPIGQGSGICGCIMARDLLGLKTEIVGVQSTEAPSYALSFAAGTIVTTETSNTLADGMATRIPDADAFALIRKGASRIVQVTDDEVAAGDPRLLDRHAQSCRGRRRRGARRARSRKRASSPASGSA